MKTFYSLLVCVGLLAFSGCRREQKYEKGFSVSPETESSEKGQIDGLAQDSAAIKTRPSSVLLTGYPEYRLTTIYKLNYNEKNDYYFTGSNNFYQNYSNDGRSDGNQWHYNFMPGLEAVYGYNLVNVSLMNVQSKKQKELFEKPVLIKTLYIPSFSKDTLQYKPVLRDYYMVSVYNEDTNNDGYINLDDLRRFFVFDLNGENRQNLIPADYSVVSSEYDSANDFMYVFAQLDENKNGSKEETEPVHVFWIDLKNPRNNGRQY